MRGYSNEFKIKIIVNVKYATSMIPHKHSHGNDPLTELAEVLGVARGSFKTRDNKIRVLEKKKFRIFGVTTGSLQNVSQFGPAV